MLELAARGFTVLHINLCGRNPPPLLILAQTTWHNQTTVHACAYEHTSPRFTVPPLTIVFICD